MRIAWTPTAWSEYIYWQSNNKKVFKKINDLISDTVRNPKTGIGKPEALRYNLSGLWSRRITQEHRLVYRILEDEIRIIQCKYHY